MTLDIVEQWRAIRAALALRPGERVLDIGSGPGFLAAEIAAEAARPVACTASTQARPCSPAPAGATRPSSTASAMR